jgi:hypothetical protein
MIFLFSSIESAKCHAPDRRKLTAANYYDQEALPFKIVSIAGLEAVASLSDSDWTELCSDSLPRMERFAGVARTVALIAIPHLHLIAKSILQFKPSEVRISCEEEGGGKFGGILIFAVEDHPVGRGICRFVG